MSFLCMVCVLNRNCRRLVKKEKTLPANETFVFDSVATCQANLDAGPFPYASVMHRQHFSLTFEVIKIHFKFLLAHTSVAAIHPNAFICQEETFKFIFNWLRGHFLTQTRTSCRTCALWTTVATGLLLLHSIKYPLGRLGFVRAKQKTPV